MASTQLTPQHHFIYQPHPHPQIYLSLVLFIVCLKSSKIPSYYGYNDYYLNHSSKLFIQTQNDNQSQMLQQSVESKTNLHKHLQSIHSTTDHQLKDQSQRKKLHHLLSQNFELRELLSCLQKELRIGEQQRKELREQLRIAIEEISINDKDIQYLKNNQQEQQATVKQLKAEIQYQEQEIEKQKKTIDHLLEHNHNLEIENKLVIEIKQKYLLSLEKSKLEIDYLRKEHESLAIQNEILSVEITKLVGELTQLQAQIEARKTQLQDYQKFVLEKLNNAKNSPQYHQKCSLDYEDLYKRYYKYKQKSNGYRQERDQLMIQLETVSKEINSNTMRKYYEVESD